MNGRRITIITLNITGFTSEGTGIARTDKGVVFVQGALPGEKVNAEIVARKKDFMIADTISIEQASPGRVTPRCKYYGKCGGCQLQHADYDTQLTLKAEIVRDAMTRIGGFNVNPECEPSPKFWGYRNKASFPVQNLKGKIATGFYRAGTHRLELIKQCPVNAKRLDEMYEKVLAALDNNRYPFDGYDERTNKGKKFVIIRD